MSQRRKQVIRICKSRGWTIHPDVLGDLERIGIDHLQDTILPTLAQSSSKGRCITPAVWQIFLQQQQEHQEDDEAMVENDGKLQLVQNPTVAVTADGKIEVVSAFHAPKVVYEEHRKQFLAVPRKGNVLGHAEDKVDMLLQRYHWLRERVLSHHLFRPTNLHERPHTLTPVASLLGGNYASNLVLLLAIVVRTSDSEFALEDPTGQVDADWSECAQQDSLVTEHSIILVEGTFHDQVFTVRQLRQPLHDENNRLRIANLPLAPAAPDIVPVTAVVYGTTHFQSVLAKERPDVLIVLLKTTSELADVTNFTIPSTTIVVVPPAHRAVWPVPPLSSATTTNPAQVSCNNSSMHILALNDPSVRQQWHTASLFRAPPATAWWQTALDQGSLLPPTTPVYWNCQQPRLYPIPQAMVVVDGGGGKSMVEEYVGCHVLQLGSADETEYGVLDEDGWRVSSVL